ncbi:MAG: phosphoribosylanthranilate isomerase [Dehalococcoidales bacterium]|nr:phosphoribosylanthranilate isomerase [Dehalococcoidales bacterium]
MTRIKICGITEKSHALAAVESGSDFVGLVFAPSRRQVSISRAQEIVSVIKEHSNTVEVVGVFVNMPASIVNRTAVTCDLDCIQLSGDESWAYCGEINRPLIKAVRLAQGQDPEAICGALVSGDRLLSGQRHLYLLDSLVKDSYGGTGITSDWKLFREIAKQFPVIIAGGLTPENAARAIEMISPWGVDVSSGVESAGIKDVARIKAFVDVVRRVDGRE